MPNCTHHKMFTKDEMDEIRDAVEKMDQFAIPRLPPVDVKTIGEAPCGDFKIACCDLDNRASSAVEIEVEGKRYVRAKATCPCCERWLTSYFERNRVLAQET